MKTRYTTVAGFLAASALLSGSALAFAPTFNDALFPTVTITDRTSAANPAPFDTLSGGPAPTSSEYVFRFEDAIDLGDYIGNLGAASSLNDVKFVFTESKELSGPIEPGSAGTLEIGGVTSVGAIPVPGTGDAAFSGANAGTAGVLDFRNIDFSPTGGFPNAAGTSAAGPFTGVGAVTGEDIKLSLFQERFVDLYIDAAGSNAINGTVVRSLKVVTELSTDGNGDRTTDPVVTDPFVPLPGFTADFSGWIVGPNDNRILFIPNGTSNNQAAAGAPTPSPNLNGFTLTPAVTNALGTSLGTTNGPVGVASTAAQIGFSGLALPGANASNGVSLTAGSIYRVRFSALSSNATTKGAILGFAVGIPNDSGVAGARFLETRANPALVDGTTRKLPQLGTTAQNVDIYLESEATVIAPIQIQLIDVGSAAANADEVTVNSYSVAVAPNRAALGAGTVIKNIGGALSTIDPAETGTAPAAATEAFGVVGGTTPGVDIFFTTNAPNNFGLNNAYNETWTRGASGANVSVAFPADTSTGANTQWESTSVGFAASGIGQPDVLNTGLDFAFGKLYAVDVWMRSNVAAGNGTTGGALAPFMIIAVNFDSAYLAGGQFGISNRTNNAASFSNQLRRWSAIVTPPDQGTTPTAKPTVNVQFAHTDDAFRLTASTVTIERLVITEYDPF